VAILRSKLALKLLLLSQLGSSAKIASARCNQPLDTSGAKLPYTRELKSFTFLGSFCQTASRRRDQIVHIISRARKLPAAISAPNAFVATFDFCPKQPIRRNDDVNLVPLFTVR
jgi:hypothetical protein